MGEIIVKTTSDKKFICDLDHEWKCWTEIDYEPIVFGNVLCFKDCPENHTIQIIKVIGLLHNFGGLSFMYSLHDDGNIYVKISGFVYPPGYMIGAIFGGFCAFIAFIGKGLFSGIIHYSKKLRSNNVSLTNENLSALYQSLSTIPIYGHTLSPSCGTYKAISSSGKDVSRR